MRSSVVVSAVGATGCAEQDIEAAVVRCVPDRGSVEVEGYDGRSEEAVAADLTAAGQEVRVLGRDGGCDDRDDDLHPNRVNLYIADGLVVWAGAF